MTSEVTMKCQVSTGRWCDSCSRKIVVTSWWNCTCKVFDLCVECYKPETSCTTFEEHKKKHKTNEPDAVMKLIWYHDDEDTDRLFYNKARLANILTNGIKRDAGMALILQTPFDNQSAKSLENPAQINEPIDDTTKSNIDIYSKENAGLKLLEYLQSGKKIRILSLDGGGIRGYMTIKIIEQIVNQFNNVNGHSGNPFLDSIDYFVGTSTGGLIAFCLAVRYPIEKIVKIYEKGDKLFEKRIWSWWKPIFCSKYDPSSIHTQIDSILKEVWNNKRNELKEQYDIGEFDLNTFTMGKLQEYFIKPNGMRAFAATTFDCVKGGIHIFNSSFRGHGDVLVHDVLKSTMAAPTYFPPYQNPKSILVDGGVFANNPELGALWIARENESQYTKYAILSLGTGVSPSQYDRDMSTGYLGWAGKFVGLFFEANTSYTETIIGNLAFTGNLKRFRFNCEFKKDCELDDLEFPTNYTKLVEPEIKNSPEMKSLMKYCETVFINPDKQKQN